MPHGPHIVLLQVVDECRVIPLRVSTLRGSLREIGEHVQRQANLFLPVVTPEMIERVEKTARIYEERIVSATEAATARFSVEHSVLAAAAKSVAAFEPHMIDLVTDYSKLREEAVPKISAFEDYASFFEQLNVKIATGIVDSDLLNVLREEAQVGIDAAEGPAHEALAEVMSSLEDIEEEAEQQVQSGESIDGPRSLKSTNYGVLHGGQAHDALEVSGQVRLIVEPDLRSGDRDGRPRPQERLGTPYPKVRLIRMRCHAYGPPEHATEMEGADAGDAGQVRQRDVLRGVLFQVRSAEADRASLPAGRSWRLHRCGVTPDQQHERFNELRLPLQCG
jgi:hypothetical protein